MLYTFVYSFVADHYQYVACIGPFALAAAAMTKGAGLIGKEQPFLKPALCGSLLVALGILTWRQAGLYADVDTLWRATIDRNPDSFMAQNNLANDLMAQGQVEEAIAHYRRALEIRPAGAAVDYNLGIALASRGQVEEAILHFRRALELRPDGAAIAYKLANALLSKGQLDESIVYYRRALEIEPEGAAIACSLGNALNEKGQVGGERRLRVSPGRWRFRRAWPGLTAALAPRWRARGGWPKPSRNTEPPWPRNPPTSAPLPILPGCLQPVRIRRSAMVPGRLTWPNGRRDCRTSDP